MKGFTKCANNHFYKETLAACPYCPEAKKSGGPDTDVTKTAHASGETQKTEYFGGGTGATESFTGDRTKIFSPGDSAAAHDAPRSSGASPQMPFDRTYIAGMHDASGQGANMKDGESAAPRASRKITGWIVSFTLDPMGVDFRIYEGNNTIGREASNSIKISTDPTISGKHATILNRNGRFWVKDEMAANGCYLNGQEMEIQKAYELNDKDELRLGDTVFKFKTCD